MERFHAEAIRDLTMKFSRLRDADDKYHHLSDHELDLWEYLQDMYKYSNQGIKGRGKDRKVLIINQEDSTIQQQQPLNHHHQHHLHSKPSPPSSVSISVSNHYDTQIYPSTSYSPTPRWKKKKRGYLNWPPPSPHHNHLSIHPDK